MAEQRIEQAIENLLAYAVSHRLITESDVRWARNQLIQVLALEHYQPACVQESYQQLVSRIVGSSITELLTPLLDYAAAVGVLTTDTTTTRDLLDAQLMGCLMPRPSEVIAAFNQAYAVSPQTATAYFSKLSLASNYIRKDRTDNNKVWQVNTPFGVLDITINLSRPEKDPKEIEAERNAVKAAYPKCLLCAENEGYMGRLNHPARQNHRIIPTALADEAWFFQYSPYAYYNEHAIVLSEAHRPMKIERKTFQRLLDFVAWLPHYFVGSNADLPIVGGSILSHDHFQGGRYEFPMERASELAQFEKQGVHAAFLYWPLSVLRLKSANPAQLVDLADEILTHWRAYSDPDYAILAATEQVPHNTITPIARFKNNQFELDLVLRNNRTSALHPEGIFHPHAEIHPVKKENIGLIEVMGLAVLPPRLADEIQAMVRALQGLPLNEVEQIQIAKHQPMLEQLVATLSSATCQEAVALEKAVREAVGAYFTEGLTHCGVFKANASGIAGVGRFLAALDWRQL